MKYRVLLTTSGIGSRLGNLTKYTNKSLVPLGDKPVISYIIEKYPVNVEFVVTVGYYGNHVRDFLTIAYPDRKFIFVQVENYSGPGSSLIYSILQAESVLQCPFVFHACDTIIQNEDIPEPAYNWLGGSKNGNSSDYASLTVSNQQVTDVFEKGQLEYDSVYIGLAGIYDWKMFFDECYAIYKERHFDAALSDIHISPRMIKNGKEFKFCNFDSWVDIGNTVALQEAKNIFPGRNNILHKDEESIFFINNHVIKFFHNQEIADNRVFRANELSGLVPKISMAQGNFYKYPFVDGDLLSEKITEQLVEDLLIFSKQNLWIEQKCGTEFPKLCENFYFTKTIQRANKFLEKHQLCHKIDNINGYIVPSIIEILDNIDKKWLCDVSPYLFHGDFILENILVTKNGFMFIDWRQDFSGSLEKGDIYYDLAKFHHNLIMNHEVINNHGFKFKTGLEITADVLVSYHMNECRQKFLSVMREWQLDIRKINFLTGLIWVNMAALHSYPLDMFLFYFGKYYMYRSTLHQ